MITVWDSAEARERFFAERLTPAYEEAGLSFSDTKRNQFERGAPCSCSGSGSTRLTSQ